MLGFVARRPNTWRVLANTAAKRSLASGGIIDNLLHGSSSIKEEQLIATTHSKLLNLGKFIYEFRFEHVRPSQLEEYEKLVKSGMPAMFSRGNKGAQFFGSWKTTLGLLDSYVHIVKYRDYQMMQDSYVALKTDKEAMSFRKHVAPMLLSRSNEVCLEFSFLESQDPRPLDGIFELRTYQLKPGNLLEWGTNWRAGMECRKKWSTPVGAWFSQLGTLHRVHHMWHYKDLAHRKTAREKAWNENGWPNTVSRTVPLLQNMKAEILELL